MKLWLLRPINADTGPWDPWYGKCFGFVVRSESEEGAREMATIHAGDEQGYEYVDGKLTPSPFPIPPWKDKTLSSCLELVQDGLAEMIIQDIHLA